MKKLMCFCVVFLISVTVFAESMTTGQKTDYFPISAPMVGSKGGSYSSCYVTKIAHFSGSFFNQVYELVLTSCDWVSTSVFPISFSYFVKVGDSIDLEYQPSFYRNETKTIVITSIKDNHLEFEVKKGDTEDIVTTEDAL